MSPQTQTHRLRLTRTKVQSNTLPKGGSLIRRLKLDIEELETKLEGSEFQSGITSTKKEHLKEVVLTSGMKSALL